ncbi:MAG: hypothetical protein E7351_01815 [Clostridiales bacterium]|nr:hypothetical protein [Clostridiales bacterium]
MIYNTITDVKRFNPTTGLPLPFISAGSTSLLVFMSAIGVVLNVDRQSRKNKI